MSIRREDFEDYQHWRAAWSAHMEPVISDENYATYERLLDEDKYKEADAFFLSVMDNAAMERNIAKAKELGI